jgi:phage protein D
MTFPSSGIAVYAPTFKVKLGGEEIPIEDITGIEVDEQIENSGMCVISFNDILDMKKQKFRWLDDARIKIGTRIEVSFSYAQGSGNASSSGGNSLLFIGSLHAITHNFDSGGSSKLEVRGYDLSCNLMRSRKGKGIYENKSYSEIVGDVAEKYGLKQDKIESSTPVYESVSRNPSEDDYQFVKRLAAALQYEFFVREEFLYFRKPKDSESANITFTNGINIVSFSTETSISTYVSEVQINFWNSNQKEKSPQTAKQEEVGNSFGLDLTSQQGKKIVLENVNASSVEEANALAVAELTKRNQNLITGNLTSIGNPYIRPAMTVKVEKIGTHFSGAYYVKNTKHSINQKGYSTTLKLRRCG